MFTVKQDALVVIVDATIESRELIKNYFALKGVTVLAFSNAQAVLFEMANYHHDKPLSLLVTDMYILGDPLNGQELADRLKPKYPSMQAVIIVNQPTPLDTAYMSEKTGNTYLRCAEKGKDKGIEQLLMLNGKWA